MLLYAVLIVAILLLLKILPELRKWLEIMKKLDGFPGPKMSFIGDVEYMTSTNDEAFNLLKKRCEQFRNGFLCRYLTEPAVTLVSAEHIEKVFSNVKHADKSKTYVPLQPWLGTGLLTSSGQKWHNRRKILTPTFHFNILQEFSKVFYSESKKLVENLKENCNTEIDIKPFISKMTLHSICETAMGISLSSFKDERKYRQSIHDFGEIYAERLKNAWLTFEFVFYFTRLHSFQKKTVNFLHSVSSHVVAERKQYINETLKGDMPHSERKKDKKVALLDFLLTSQIQNGDIDDEGIREEVDTFLFEGYDTTSLSLTYTLMLLANNRDCQDKIYEEIFSIFGDSDREPANSDLNELKYMEMCIKESLRLYPSVPYIGRTAGSDIELEKGLTIPKGVIVFISIFGLHRDPKVFQNPHKFDPDRFLPENVKDRHPFAYLPFSGGPRNCIGQKFAMLEMKSCLTEILKNFILEPVDKPEDLKFYFHLVLRNKGPVRVKFVPRK